MEDSDRPTVCAIRVILVYFLFNSTICHLGGAVWSSRGGWDHYSHSEGHGKQTKMWVKLIVITACVLVIVSYGYI